MIKVEFNNIARMIIHLTIDLVIRSNDDGDIPESPSHDSIGDIDLTSRLFWELYLNHKIKLIKATRIVTGWGLLDSKNFVDNMATFNRSMENQVMYSLPDKLAD